jgi:ATP-dependent DNA ligase
VGGAGVDDIDGVTAVEALNDEALDWHDALFGGKAGLILDAADEPSFTAEIEYGEITLEGLLRQCSFKRLNKR